ncbi:DoxX family protein [Terriglobus aquaticus]|uniref:DoxX family protein n=1 Tax=Terriglobus aquaticus TaxID=940139 RepID=A0ABW9KPR7_9BACT|nr:DoxX family protein [Terriglobus aquaticus]
MKYAVLIARILLGLAFVAAGVMNILHLKQKPMPGDGGLFLSILSTHGYMTVVALVMLVGGLLLLVGRFVPLGLTLLGPVIVNILLFHIFFAPSGLVEAAVILALDIFLVVVYRRAFLGIFAAGPEVLGSPKL